MSQYKGFSSVELRKPKRSMFDLSHEKRLSTRMGRLVPIFISETLPNDTFKVSSEVMLRLAPLLAPIMHRVNVFVHYFFVPNRILWKDWEKFITGGTTGLEVPPDPPHVSMIAAFSDGNNYFAKSGLWDYFNNKPIPDSDSGSWIGIRKINALPFLAYQKIYFDYYADQNFYTAEEGPYKDMFPFPSGVISGAGSVRALTLTMKNRNWQRDYFTSALPWTQRGAEVLMPIEGWGKYWYNDDHTTNFAHGGTPVWAIEAVTGRGALGTSANSQKANIKIDQSTVSINDLRRAVRLQEWLERNALAGSRYNESIMAHFARKTSDGRLQRAQYLGGGKVPVQISEVLTTAYSEDGGANTVPPANMAGHGISVGKSNRFKYNCEEHGFVIGIMSVMPTSSYMQGFSRMIFERNDKFDYPWPSFAHLGEQPVYKYEIYGDPTNLPDVDFPKPLFGYQSRYADWKSIESSSHGDFRDTLDFWHLTRKFASAPVLSHTFNKFEDALQNRIFAVSNVDVLWCYIYNNAKVVRSLPYFGTPML